MLHWMSDRLTPLDASFLEIEEQDEASHMHIGWAMVFDPPPDGSAPTLERLEAQLEPMLRGLPHFRARLSEQHTGGLARPSWVPDERFDLPSHLRHAALPAPGAQRDLLDWLGDFWSHRLDRARPLWELVLLEGLEGGRWALVTKTHHCLVDGMSSIDVTRLLLDASPDPAPVAAAPEPASVPGEQPLPVRVAGALVAHPRAAAAELVRRTRGVVGLLVRDELVGAPHTSLDVPIGGQRHFAVARADLDELKAIKARLGGTLNDVVLAAATGALRAFLEHRGEPLPPQGLRAMVPVSLRAAGESGTLGNRVSSLFVDLPVAIADPAVRYARVVEVAESLKAGSQAMGSDSVVQATGLIPPALHATRRANAVLAAAVQHHHHERPGLPHSPVRVRCPDARGAAAGARVRPACGGHRGDELRRRRVLRRERRRGLGAGRRSAGARARLLHRGAEGRAPDPPSAD